MVIRKLDGLQEVGEVSLEYAYGDDDFARVRELCGKEPSEEVFGDLLDWVVYYRKGENGVVSDSRFCSRGGKELHGYVKEHIEHWPLECLKLPERLRRLLFMEQRLGCLQWIKAAKLGQYDDLEVVLKNVPFLEYMILNMWGDTIKKQIAALEKFPLLRSLKASLSFVDKGDVNLLGRLTGLERFSLEEERNLECEFIKDMALLERLSLRETAFQDVSLLSENLKRLNLYGCRSLQDIEGIEQCQDLEWLNLGSTYQLQNLEPVAGLKKLTRLHLARKSDLQASDLSFLSEMEGLREVVVDGCPGLVESREFFEGSYPHITFYFDRETYPKIDIGMGE